jgi:hypothetical protein
MLKGQYLTLLTQPNGLILKLEPPGKEELNNHFLAWLVEIKKLEEDFYDLFEDIQINSEYLFHHDMGEAGFGLTQTPGFTKGYFYNEKDQYEALDENAKIYWYPNYQIKSFLKELYETGETFFNLG